MAILALASMGTLAEKSVRAADNSAVIYERDSAKSAVLFRFTHTESPDGKSAKNVYTDAQGQEAVIEEMSFDQGRLVRYVFLQKQLDEKGSLEIKDGKVLFSYTHGGKTETDDEKLTPDLVSNYTLIPYIQAHWQALMKGDTVGIRYGAVERKETVGFKLFKVEEKKSPSGKDLAVIKMKPTSFVIAALVDPVLFTLEKDTLKPVEILGRVVPRQKADGKWKDLDARFVFQ